MENNFDVIIIGAGPAGLECAKQFEGSEFSVLLVEKNKEIGPKVCAGGLTCLSSKFEIPGSITRVFNGQTVYVSGKRNKMDLAFPIRMSERRDLGKYLLNRLSGVGNVRILEETLVKEVRPEKIITDKGEFGYRYLVGADGATSVVRKYLGLGSKFSIGLRYKIPEMADEVEWHFFPKILGAGYVWIFPHKDHTNVGIFFEAKDSSVEKAKAVLRNFLKGRGFSVPFRDPEAAVLNFDYKGCIFKNVFLAGEAAGLTSRTTGEGIAPALISGREIGRKIIDPGYDLPLLKKILKIKRRQEFFKTVADIMPGMVPCFLNIFVKAIKSKKFQMYFEGRPDSIE